MEAAVQIPIVVERIENNGYRARSGEPFALTAEGQTADLAAKNLEDLIAIRVKDAVKVMTLEVPGNSHPWMPMAGMYENDPLFDEWQAIIAERRRLEDAGQELP
jgi:hypothetical protein